ncbi:MAG: ferritin [Bacteroidales bacterium]|nr:ferritin [Bacteroidales bacterium]MCF8458306.1 ferritin [Bacteroidales bacterium]
MLKTKIEDILNRQIERELYSSNLYLAMASWAETSGFAGAAEWLYFQADEEHIHMLKFIKYVNDRGGKALIPATSEPPRDFGDVHTMFKKVFEHEQFISNSINEIVGLCHEEKDFTTHNWVQWFVTEQIEEEATVRGILDKLKLLDGKDMYMFDRDLQGSRTKPVAV